MQLDGINVVGRTGIWQTGSMICGSSEIYSGYMSNGVWHGCSLSVGWLYTELRVVSGDGELNGFVAGSNTTPSDRVVVQGYAQATNGVTYLATGGGDVYNWQSGSRMVGTYNYSVLTYHTSYGQSNIVDNAMSCIDMRMGSVQAYNRTDTGETYGSILYERQLGLPDWISACATNGEHGYIDADDYWVPTPQNPADAVANFSGSHVRTIPVYDEPGGSKVVGWFDMRYGGSEAA